ncbi:MULTISPECIES: hypothetical protein [unclassified Moritella]|uniref:hypothetical protein n=1 Tax=unclassified Moritella TaxID=2637987 RepID=UPI001BA4D048|nr:MULTISPECIES: hypothetical protein [unclassified Moritella]QUM83188.1 hypothetical protein HWV02_00880 [Moritella sp. 28]QUM87490.1 hypothetical protein HWV03_00880 [Moritella sp. 36]
MVLVIPPPTGIPNALNPTTAAVERDAEKREITPAITPDGASASTNDSTTDKDLINYNPKKNDPDSKKKQAGDPSALTLDDDEVIVLGHVSQEGETRVDDFSSIVLSIDMTNPPETIIAEVLLLRQAILAKPTLKVGDRQQLAEINHIIKTALADLLRLKELDEVKVLAAQLPGETGVLKGENVHSHVVALDDLFASSFDDDMDVTTESVSAKSKLAGAVVGYFYGENIEPKAPSQIDQQE